MGEPVGADVHAEPAGFARMRELLAAHGPIEGIWHGPAYRFPDTPLPRSADVVRVTVDNAELLRFGFADALPRLEAIQPCVAVVEDEVVVALCCSARVGARGRGGGGNARGLPRAGLRDAGCRGLGGGGARAGPDLTVQHVVGQPGVAGRGAAAGVGDVRVRSVHRLVPGQATCSGMSEGHPRGCLYQTPWVGVVASGRRERGEW